MTKFTAEELYDAYRDKVLAYLTKRTEGLEDAHDLCHDVFVKVFRSLERYDESKSSISTWIFRITRFTLIDYIRTKHPGSQLAENIPSGDDLEESFIQGETLQCLAAALAELEKAEEKLADLSDEIDVLRDYYESGKWRKDFEADEQGKIPQNLKRGVLSEDGLWNLLEDYRWLKKTIKEPETND